MPQFKLTDDQKRLMQCLETAFLTNAEWNEKLTACRNEATRWKQRALAAEEELKTIKDAIKTISKD